MPHTENVGFRGRILFLTRDLDRVRSQLQGETLEAVDAEQLLDGISTDEMTPAWACYHYDAELARYCLVGLREGGVPVDAVKNGGFSVVVSGHSTGCGSSRETAPFAFFSAGVRLIVARSFEKIFRQNCENIGLYTSTDLSLVPRLLQAELIPLDAFTAHADGISRAVIEAGGLFAYNRERLAGKRAPLPVVTRARAMTLAEKIIARRAVVDAATNRVGLPAVAPGDACFVRADLRFSHEYVTAMADALFRQGFGEDARVAAPETACLFRDHLLFAERVMPQAQRQLGLLDRVSELVKVQEQFAHRHGLRLFGEVIEEGRSVGSEGICHNKVLEDLALPGQVVVGTDSHTCTAGALGCLAFGVGSTDMANAWLTRDVRIRVPGSVRILLEGSLGPQVCAKDVMLHVLQNEYFRSGASIGKVLEFSGSGLTGLGVDERATLTNMAVEAGALTGIVAPDAITVDYLTMRRGLSLAQVHSSLLEADSGASYEQTLEIDLGQIAPMVALPGDPRNGVPLAELEQHTGGPVRVDVAYGGSCTGGKETDFDFYAEVLKRALRSGRRVADGVEFFIQFGSQAVRRYAERQGYIDLFQDAGVKLLDPACGACIRAGPGVSINPEQVTISAINRNFPGRSGPGRVFLASPRVVAASAVLGKISHPDAL